MRARHPDFFSDTQVDEVSQLSKVAFEYHLDTLTSRKQEYQFEYFCRKLAEKTICPNLRVQTGPTGGGDSKVDTETYPVAEEIAERWWIGSSSAGTERWAFAFSAKKKWKPKVIADVNNILSTGRDYKRIYFFTNQFVSDRERSNQESVLSKQAEIPVYIIDRAWIVEKVYEAGHLELAITALGIEGAQSKKINRPGPRDTTRLAELEELDRQVADPARYQGARYQLVEDCLRSAILARGLERPRNEVESRFAQADLLAQAIDNRQQRLRIAYNRAWTVYWWYEDYSAFNLLYREVEQRVEGSSQASEIDLLVTLWQLLTPLVATGRINTQDAKVESRRQRLTAMLEAIAADPLRLNNVLQARTSLTFMRITQIANQAGQSDLLESCWLDLAQIVDETTALGDYPVEWLFHIVNELGEYIDNPAFDALYEKMVCAIRQRRSDGEAGEAYAERGVQKLRQEKSYESIQCFGRAEELLIKDEYRTKLVRTLIGSSYAYERVGLLWAARSKLLAAVERTLVMFNKQGKMIPQALIALKRLVWIELQLGRIPHILSAMNLSCIVASLLKMPEDQQSAYIEEQRTQEAVLGIHFLNLPVEALSNVARMPDTLKRLGFDLARMALLFTLGQEQSLRDEGYIQANEDSDAVQTFFELWQDQPATEDIPPQPVLAEGTTCFLKSIILGSELVIETPNNAISVGIAESLLGALEAFLATSDEEDVLPHRAHTTIVVSESNQLTGVPQLRFSDEDRSRVDIVHPANLTFSTADQRQNYMDWLKDSLAQIACRFLLIWDPQSWLAKIASRERAFSRALTLGDALTLGSNVFGEQPRVRLIDWLDTNANSYAVLRDRHWRKVKPANRVRPLKPPEFGSGPPPTELMAKERLKHTDRRILSLIDVPLWDQAKWRGTLFACFPGKLPILAIVFENEQAGQAIFRAWKGRWGNEDKDEAIRLAIITGLSKRNPAEYAVVVGPNFQQMAENEKKLATYVFRINRMSPTTSTNLDNFITAYEKAGVFLLAPAQLSANITIPRMPFVQFALTKRRLALREAWQIGENDPDISALDDNDEPIIPAGVTDPPVNKALMRRRNMSRDR